MTTLTEVRERFAHITDENERERLMCEALMAPPPPPEPGKPARGRRRRNYKAMLDENLLQAQYELVTEGEAFTRSLERGSGDPDGDLMVVNRLLGERGLTPHPSRMI